MPVGRSVRPSVLLIVNPTASTTRPRLRDLIVAALAGTVDLAVTPTRGRGHATELAADAVADGRTAVVVLGGDGTANEAVQALAGTHVALGLVPGGGANVLARALGLPSDPVAATAHLLTTLRTDRRRRIGLGRLDDRLFAFNAGMGFDAAVVHRVERSPARKQLLRQLAFAGSALAEWTTVGRRTAAGHAPTVVAELSDGRTSAPAPIVLVGNAQPYTVIGEHAVLAHPDAAFEHGLDLLLARPAGLGPLVLLAAGALAGGRHVRLAGVEMLADLAAFTLCSPVELPVHVDGDPLPSRCRARFESIPDALDVLT
jgi:diacylglycerol kinase family enzyme